ncbi:MAG: ATP-binding protein [Betaproteobacteria bacterium]
MLFSQLQEKDFVDRQEELDGLSARVLQADGGRAQSVVLSGVRGIGKTELLRHLFGRLFWKQERIAPFQFTVNPAVLSAAAFAKTYLCRFLCQRLAFQKREQALLMSDGISLDALTSLVEEQEALWAKEILDQYVQNSGDPLDALQVALAAPRRSVVATGTPVAILIDDFHLLSGLHLGDSPDPRLVSLFEEPVSYGKTPHVITGNAAELQEMPVTGSLERMPLLPFSPEGASSKVFSLLSTREARTDAPPLLLRRLGGNPLYLDCVVTTACAANSLDDKDFWNAYIREITEGTLSLSWMAAFKRAFPGLGIRKAAIEMAYKIYHSTEPLSCRRMARMFSLPESGAEDMAHALYLAGIIRGEFGVFRAVEDPVLKDIIDCLYRREVLGKSLPDLEKDFLERLVPQKEHEVRFDITLPMAKDAELVAAQGLEQIGKSLGLSQDAVGQMQIAVIEACINAMEHGRGTEGKVFVSISADDDRLEVSVESAGREFIIQETGEPFNDPGGRKTPGRGWGIKLIKRFVDHIKFEKTSRGTKVVLVKKLAKSPDLQKENAKNHE